MGKRERLVVVKVGGNVIDNQEKLAVFIEQFTRIEGKKILVHGGGKLATDLSQRLGIETEMIEGRRVTDEKTIDVVTMVYGGLVNKTIVAMLQAAGNAALGITGADGDAVYSERRALKNGIDYGYVGDVREVNDKLIKTLLNDEFVPVIAPLTHDRRGQLLNTNADTMATEIAISLSTTYETVLVFTFELDGVMKDVENSDSLLRHINSNNYQDLKTEGVIHSGMIPKLDNAFYALNSGISRLYIGNYAKLKAIVSGETDVVTLISNN